MNDARKRLLLLNIEVDDGCDSPPRSGKLNASLVQMPPAWPRVRTLRALRAVRQTGAPSLANQDHSSGTDRRRSFRPSRDVLEAFHMGIETETEIVELKKHLLSCQDCLNRLKAALLIVGNPPGAGLRSPNRAGFS